MNVGVVGTGIALVLIGLFLAIGERSKRERMEIKIGGFKNPIWFFTIVSGIIIALVGIVVPGEWF